MANVETQIATFETTIPYEFDNKVLCARALSTYPTMGVIEGVLRTLPRNDRMAVYGDAVVESYFCRKWFDAGLEKSTVASCATISHDDMLIFSQVNGLLSATLFWEMSI
jgi:dsRNA-specific ribonuclease